MALPYAALLYALLWCAPQGGRAASVGRRVALGSSGGALPRRWRTMLFIFPLRLRYALPQ